MSRTTRDYGAPVAAFLAENRRLLVFLVLFLCGVAGGCLVFLAAHDMLTGDLALILRVRPVEKGLAGAAAALGSSCFSVFLLLALLFLCGLSACGAPVTALVPLFFGLGVGLTEAYYYGIGGAGILFTVLFVIPHNLLAAAALLMGCSESLRMTLLLSGQLLPSVHCGGLWQDFKLYCVRFAMFLGVMLASGVVDVTMRLFFLRWFL